MSSERKDIYGGGLDQRRFAGSEAEIDRQRVSFAERTKDGLSIRPDDVVEATEFSSPPPSTIFEEEEEEHRPSPFNKKLHIPDMDAEDAPSTPRRNIPQLLTPDAGGAPGPGLRRKASVRRPHARRRSSIGGAQPNVQVLSIPQLDAIQRTQKLLDVRLQHLQSQTDAYGLQAANQRVMDDIEHIRSLLGENQKAMFSIVKAVSTMQEEIHGLIYNLGQWFTAQSELKKMNSDASASSGGKSHPSASSGGKGHPNQSERKSDDHRGDYRKVP